MTSTTVRTPLATPAQIALQPGGHARRIMLSSPQKAALVIAALGPEAAGPIIERISDKHLRAFAEAYANLHKIPHHELMAVVEEFVSNLQEDGLEVGGGYEMTRRLLSQFKGEDEIDRLMDDVDAPGGRTVWDKLGAVDVHVVSAYLAAQHPQTIAVILSRTDPEKASQILGELDAVLAQEVVIRLSKPINIRREALRVLADTIESELLAPMRKKTKAKNPGAMIGALMNNLSSEKRQNLLEFISTKTPEIYDSVKEFILTFEDIPTRVPPKAIPIIVREIEVDTLLKAAKYGRQNAPETVEYLFKNVSQRMAQQYEEQIEQLKQVSVTEAEVAQTVIMSTVRRLVASGEFELIKIVTEEEDTEVYL